MFVLYVGGLIKAQLKNEDALKTWAGSAGLGTNYEIKCHGDNWLDGSEWVAENPKSLKLKKISFIY